jgi:DNA polymerase elongation subunit (family B)
MYKDRGKQLYESDISVEQKVMSKHYYGAEMGPLNITFFDIEVDYCKDRGFSSVEHPYAPISSIALYHLHTHKRVIFAVPPQYSPYEPTEKEYTIDDISENVTSKAKIVICKSERELLDAFLREIQDTDLISGWNSDYFDIPYTYKRIRDVLGKRSLPRMCFPDSKSPTIRPVEREVTQGFKVTEEVVRLFGRTTVDYKLIYEKFERENKASYALAYIAEEEFPDMRKLEYEGSLYDLYRSDFSYYLEYNMIDTEILVELEEKKKYIALTLQSSHMATGQVAQIYGTIKLAELAIINYCHYELNKRVPDSKNHDYFSKYGGAFVLDCQRGEHKMVGSVDVESLYPTGIMSVNASPETIIGQFEDNELAYAAIADATGEELSFAYENGDVAVKTTEEWRQLFKDKNYTLSGYGTVFDQNNKGVIPAVLESWFAERRQYKGELAKYKDELEALDKSDPKYNEVKEKTEFYDRLQYIKKIQLNSLYGCMGNKFFKFFDIRLAETTTKTGREILIHMAKHIGETLDGEYTFPTDSVVYGDTDSCYFKTHTDNINDAKRVCTYIENSINKSFPVFMKERFFCDDQRASRARVESEIISDIGIFVSKKIYLLHLVHSDGQDVDKMKIMGHAVKKTNITKTVKTHLTEILESYFKTHDWAKFNKDIVKFKKFLEHDASIEDIGLPGKVNKVEPYTEQFNADPNARLPGRQSAAIFWNICLDKYEDLESPKITSQMAVRTYYLDMEFGRFGSIAVPSDLVTIPDWFKENFVPIIDVDKQINRLVDKTLTNICEAVGKLVPTDKAVLADELLVY